MLQNYHVCVIDCNIFLYFYGIGSSLGKSRLPCHLPYQQTPAQPQVQEGTPARETQTNPRQLLTPHSTQIARNADVQRD